MTGYDNDLETIARVAADQGLLVSDGPSTTRWKSVVFANPEAVEGRREAVVVHGPGGEVFELTLDGRYRKVELANSESEVRDLAVEFATTVRAYFSGSGEEAARSTWGGFREQRRFVLDVGDRSTTFRVLR